MVRSLFGRIVNIVGKGGDAGNQHFPLLLVFKGLFPQCCQKPSSYGKDIKTFKTYPTALLSVHTKASEQKKAFLPT